MDEFSPCGTPNGLNVRDLQYLQFGQRMFYNTQDMLWRKKLQEQADLQQAIELQQKWMMKLHLLDIKKHHHRALSVGVSASVDLQLASVADGKEIRVDSEEGNADGNRNRTQSPNQENNGLRECSVLNLPNNPLASPAKAMEIAWIPFPTEPRTPVFRMPQLQPLLLTINTTLLHYSSSLIHQLGNHSNPLLADVRSTASKNQQKLHLNCSSIRN